MDHIFELKRIIINQMIFFWIDTTTRIKKKTIGKCTFYRIVFNRDFAALFDLLMSNDCIFFTLKLNITFKVCYEYFFRYKNHIFLFMHFLSFAIHLVYDYIIITLVMKRLCRCSTAQSMIILGNISKHSSMKIRLYLILVVVSTAVVHAD